MKFNVRLVGVYGVSVLLTFVFLRLFILRLPRSLGAVVVASIIIGLSIGVAAHVLISVLDEDRNNFRKS